MDILNKANDELKAFWEEGFKAGKESTKKENSNVAEPNRYNVLADVLADIKQYAYQDEHGEYYVSISQLENILSKYFS